MLCLSGFELHSRWVPQTVRPPFVMWSLQENFSAVRSIRLLFDGACYENKLQSTPVNSNL